MEIILLIDFGSTYTKLTAVDQAAAEVIATAKAPTTVNTNIMDGLNAALEKLRRKLSGKKYSIVEKIASSSAAGGLRMDAIGLVPNLTLMAARSAVLNAGAKLVGCYSYELTPQDVQQIIDGKSDIILLAGGTDGGNRDIVVHNAEMLAASELSVPVVVSCNRSCSQEVYDVLAAKGKEAILTENVLPQLDHLNIEPVRKCIREIFISRIIQAKGIEAATKYVDEIMMPTPIAVLKGAQLYAEGTQSYPGLGELILVDVGGATTDVHSVSTGNPTKTGMIPKGIPEPYAKRTVEGDMGVRWNAKSIAHEVGIEKLTAKTGLEQSAIEKWLEEVTANPERLPETENERIIDKQLAYEAVRISVARHVGYIETHHTLMGVVYALYGKDLSIVRNVIGTGGPLVNSPDPAAILRAAVFDPDEPDVLRPLHPVYYVDSKYILYACGLLSERKPDLAMQIMKKYICAIPETTS